MVAVQLVAVAIAYELLASSAQLEEHVGSVGGKIGSVAGFAVLSLYGCLKTFVETEVPHQRENDIQSDQKQTPTNQRMQFGKQHRHSSPWPLTQRRHHFGDVRDSELRPRPLLSHYC